jgi:hypothetical protein
VSSRHCWCRLYVIVSCQHDLIGTISMSCTDWHLNHHHCRLSSKLTHPLLTLSLSLFYILSTSLRLHIGASCVRFSRESWLSTNPSRTCVGKMWDYMDNEWRLRVMKPHQIEYVVIGTDMHVQPWTVVGLMADDRIRAKVPTGRCAPSSRSISYKASFFSLYYSSNKE